MAMNSALSKTWNRHDGMQLANYSQSEQTISGCGVYHRACYSIRLSDSCLAPQIPQGRIQVVEAYEPPGTYFGIVHTLLYKLSELCTIPGTGIPRPAAQDFSGYLSGFT